MSWSRADCAAALCAQLQAAMGESVFIFPKPPQTLNPPAVVISRPAEVRFSSFAFSIDEADLPLLCVGAADGEDVVSDLIAQVRAAVSTDLTLGGVVQCVASMYERNWRNLTIAGADILQAELWLTIQM